MLVLHSDSTWLKFQNYKENSMNWMNILSDYQWKWFLEMSIQEHLKKE